MWDFIQGICVKYLWIKRDIPVCSANRDTQPEQNSAPKCWSFGSTNTQMCFRGHYSGTVQVVCASVLRSVKIQAQSTQDATQANGTCCCEWECPHCTQTTSKEKRSNLRARRVASRVLCGLGLRHYCIMLGQVPTPIVCQGTNPSGPNYRHLPLDSKRNTK